MKDQHDIWDELELSSAPESLEEEMFYLISAYADGECTPKERRLVEAYLGERREAQVMLSEIRSQVALVRSGKLEPPDWLREAILGSTTRSPRLIRRIVLSRPVAFAASASALGAAAVLFWPSQPSHEAGPAGDVVAVTDSRPIQLDVSPTHIGGAVDPHAGEPIVVSDASPRAPRMLTSAVHPTQSPPVGGLSPGTARPEPRNGHTAGSGGSASAPVVRMGPESGPVARAVPEQPDVVALAGMSSEGEESTLESRPQDPKAVESGKDPRDDLRKRLRAVNQDSDVQDAFKGSK